MRTDDELLQRMRRAVRAAVNEADPLGLLLCGAPPGEYDPGVSAILEDLEQSWPEPSRIAALVQDVFQHYFNPLLATDGACRRVADGICRNLARLHH